MSDDTLDSNFIAIVGSANTARENYPYEPALRHVEQVKDACKAIGAALARAGYGIIVYTSSPAYIEAEVVTGYVESGAAKKDSIQVRYPNIPRAQPKFEQQTTHPHLFDFKAYQESNWQAVFVPSLQEAGGIIILGGGNSALITGLFAQTYRKPLVSIATFGGSAETVWGLLRPGRALATQEALSRMHQPTWDAATATDDLIKTLGEQREKLRREREERRQSAELAERRKLAEEQQLAAEEQRRKAEMKTRAVWAIALTLAAAGSTLMGMFPPADAPKQLFGLALFLTPALAGAAGGVMIDLFDFHNSGEYKPHHAFLVIFALGMGAGLVSALIWAGSQWSGNSALQWMSDPQKAGAEVPTAAPLLIISELLISFIAGLTLEKVFLKWKQEGYAPPAEAKGAATK